MTIQSSSDIYNVLERALRDNVEPMSCVALMDIGYVREAALAEFGSDVQATTNKLSDTLGFMWRRGVIDRFPAPRGSGAKARYAYAWPKEKKPVPPLPISPAAKKPHFTITESERDVTIEFDNVTITVRRK